MKSKNENKKYKISSTARIVSAWRSQDAALSGDIIAQYFITPEAKKLAKEYEQKIYPNIVRHLCLRSRFIEDNLIDAVKKYKIKQFVSLGAGLSTTSCRLDIFPGVKAFEVDAQEMIAYKKEKIAELFRSKRIKINPKTVNYVAGDLRFPQKIFSDLIKAKLDISLPTFYLLEGVSYYLSLGIIKKLIGIITGFKHPAVYFAMDYWPKYCKKRKVFQLMAKMFGKLDEKIYTLFSKTEIKKLFIDFDFITEKSIKQIENIYCSDKILCPPNRVMPVNVAMAVRTINKKKTRNFY